MKIACFPIFLLFVSSCQSAKIVKYCDKYDNYHIYFNIEEKTYSYNSDFSDSKRIQITSSDSYVFISDPILLKVENNHNLENDFTIVTKDEKNSFEVKFEKGGDISSILHNFRDGSGEEAVEGSVLYEPCDILNPFNRLNPFELQK